ncbi:MAG: M20/M25/M40 family metallo-hydrolase [Thermoplasmata archaeon]|nr:MAG: M20/M25/M40 family metallo-hydrolase [Thermoplasmata archaeon]
MDVVELTKKLVEIQSVTGNETEIGEFITSELDDPNVEMQKVAGFGPNVIAKHITKPEDPIIILNCHMDTVEVMQGWESDPFTPKIEGNKLYGLGACDMKAGVAIAIDVFKKAQEMDKNIVFTAVSDEEGNSKGSYVLLQKMKQEELKGDNSNLLCLIPEDTEEHVKLGARGRYVIDIDVFGCSAHGATPECGTNAIVKSTKIVDGLNDLPLAEHPIMGKGSFCILKIEGGGDSLSVPDRCTIRVDRHTVPGEDKSKIIEDFDNLLKKLNLNCEYKLSFIKRETPFLEPYILDKENPWAVKFLSAYREYCEKEAPIAYGRSVGDFNAFGCLMPTIVFGPMGENVHGSNECVFIDSIKRCRDLYLKFLEGL